jgi:hypothetical protein
MYPFLSLCRQRHEKDVNDEENKTVCVLFFYINGEHMLYLCHTVACSLATQITGQIFGYVLGVLITTYYLHDYLCVVPPNHNLVYLMSFSIVYCTIFSYRPCTTPHTWLMWRSVWACSVLMSSNGLPNHGALGPHNG